VEKSVEHFGPPNGGVDWYDFVDPSDEDLRAIAEKFGLRNRTFEEVNRRAKRPTLQRYEDHAYLVAFSGTMTEIDMYIGPEWLVTVRCHLPDDDDPDNDPTGPEWTPKQAMQRFEKRCGDAPTPGDLLATLLDELIEGYFDRTDELEDKIEALEDKIFGESAHTERDIQQHLFAIRRDLLKLRRAVTPMREVLGALARGEVDWVTGEALMQVRDVLDKLLRAVEIVDDLRELIGNAVDAHLAVMSNQMNLVMKKLTAWGSILFGATLIAGIYGMNFDHMPELHWYFGYPAALGLMMVLSYVLYRMFRGRDWL
jgi:magnesium transporter